MAEMITSVVPIELLDLPADLARAELLRSEQYCNFDLPTYLQFF